MTQATHAAQREHPFVTCFICGPNGEFSSSRIFCVVCITMNHFSVDLFVGQKYVSAIVCMQHVLSQCDMMYVDKEVRYRISRCLGHVGHLADVLPKC